MDHSTQSSSQPAAFFPGLDRHLEALYPRLEAGEKAICLRGALGMGKSTLARALAARYAGAHGAESVIQLWLDPQGVPGIPGRSAYPLENGDRLSEALLARLAVPGSLVVLDGVNHARNARPVWQAVCAAAGQCLCALDHCDDLTCASTYEVGALAPGEAAALIMLRLARRGYNLTLPVGFLERIYQAVGGAPLALSLVAGQVGRISAERLLSGLYESRQTSAEAFYTILLWRAWELLSPDGQTLLVGLLPGGYNNPQEHAQRKRLPRRRSEQAWLEVQSLGLAESSAQPLHPAVWQFVYYRSLDT
jgi:hypothetical protein